MFRFFLALLCCLATSGLAAAAPGLADGATWIHHARAELLPWWTHQPALGKPLGRFPTFRCHDGSAYDAKDPCLELARAPAWIHDELGRDYVRMQARQVFAYAMGFNLTGDVRLLRYAEAGVRDIRSRALDPETGSPVTYWQDGRGEPAIELRTAQDVAYAGAALAAWYYVSRDAATLADLDRLHRHLMTYFDPARGRMKWTLSGPEADKAELVAQLDPLNAYMILITPLLPEPMKARWQADMRRLTGTIRTQFCAGEKPRCQGTLGNPDSALPGARHNDFGHSGKAFWMSWLAAEELGDAELASWARDKGRALLREAYLPGTASWANRWGELSLVGDKDWWIYAELDQLASTLAQRERGQAAYLPGTQAFWFKYFVEPGMPEVWSSVSPDGEPDPDDLRQHQWKNGYHAMEHALVGYITAQALAGKPVRLYFAPGAAGSPLNAYLFGGHLDRSQLRTQRKGRVLVADFTLPAPQDSPDALSSLPPFSVPRIPGEVIALTAENAARELHGEWEGTVSCLGQYTEIPVRMSFDKLEGNTLSGHFLDGDRKPFRIQVGFEEGRMLGRDEKGRQPVRHYTLRRNGNGVTLDWNEHCVDAKTKEKVDALAWIHRGRQP